MGYDVEDEEDFEYDMEVDDGSGGPRQCRKEFHECRKGASGIGGRLKCAMGLARCLGSECVRPVSIHNNHNT